MKIRSKLNGEVSNVRGDIAREMVKLGVAEIISDGTVEAVGEKPYRLPRPADLQVPLPEWKVGTARTVDEVHFLAIVLNVGHNHITYFGEPRLVNAKVRTVGGGTRWFSGFGRECPAEIVEEYTRRWNADASLRGPVVQERASRESH